MLLPVLLARLAALLLAALTAAFTLDAGLAGLPIAVLPLLAVTILSFAALLLLTVTILPFAALLLLLTLGALLALAALLLLLAVLAALLLLAVLAALLLLSVLILAVLHWESPLEVPELTRIVNVRPAFAVPSGRFRLLVSVAKRNAAASKRIPALDTKSASASFTRR